MKEEGERTRVTTANTSETCKHFRTCEEVLLTCQLTCESFTLANR